uniref:Uncharacterized protein n=1 Tax=Sinocyclocheilus anshuiensis TaxID=1608454 RepID=A0A671SVB8_9TELE
MQPSPLNFQTGLKVSSHLILLSWAVLFLFRFTTSLFCSAYLFFHLIFSASTVVSEQPPPRPPKPAVLLKSKNHFSSSLQSLHYKRKFPKVLPNGLIPEPFYDSVLDDDDDLIVTGVKKLSLKTPTYLSLRLRPWESTSPSDRLSEVSLIDFGDDSFSSTSPSPITETPNPSTAKPPGTYAASILDMAPPQSPNRALPNPMHPTPVCAEQEDMEVSSINASVSQEDIVSEQTQSEDGVKIDGKCSVEDNLFLPTKHAEETHSPIEPCQTPCTLLQWEVMVKLRVPPTGLSLPSSPLLTPSALAPHRQIILPSSYEDKPQIPPRIPILPMRPSKRAGIYSSRFLCCVGSLGSLAQTPAKSPCILPIVYGGVKASSTHYYLLPEKPAYLDKYDNVVLDPIDFHCMEKKLFKCLLLCYAETKKVEKIHSSSH